MNSNAVDVIKDNVDVIKILEHYGMKNFTESGDYIRTRCLIHGGDNSTAFVMNTQTTLWSCHTGEECGGGDIFTLVEKIEGIGFVDSVKKIAEILGINIETMVIAERKSEYQKELQEWMKFIERKKKSNRQIKEYNLDGEVLPLKKYRHFTPETLSHFNAGYTKKANYINSKGEISTTYDRIVCPIYLDGVQIGASLRKTKAREQVKWLHLPTGLGVGNLIYNIDACKDYDTIIIVEGIFDVWSYHQAGIKNVVCVFGSKITEEQYKILFRTGKDIILSFDGDDAGMKATKQAVELFKNKATLYMVKFEEGIDPGGITSEELLKIYNNKERIL